MEIGKENLFVLRGFRGYDFNVRECEKEKV
jgi:hypothetical protein